ncbi:MAG: hypothetical protein HY595_05020 [Candidatus Omnitrophica bacterium]|nr:hypothetical protein [Candidatus Omnitrophota bacterium]
MSLVLVCSLSGPAQPVYADALGDLVGGVGQVLTGVFAIPLEIFQGTVNGPPILGTVGGALSGTVHAVGSTLGGVLQVAKSIVPLASSLLPFLPLFL